MSENIDTDDRTDSLVGSDAVEISRELRDQIGGRVAYALIASLVLSILGAEIYLRWISPTATSTPWNDGSVDRAKLTLYLLPIVPVALLLGVFGRVGLGEFLASWRRMAIATAIACLPVLMIGYAAHKVHDEQYKSVISDRFVDYASTVKKTKVGAPENFYGAGSQMLVCASEYERGKQQVWLGQFCLEVDGSAPDGEEAISGGYRVEDGGGQSDCFGRFEDDCN